MLIADDQADVLEALRLLLKTEGFHLETASSPAGVLAALEEHGPASQADLGRTTGIDTSDVVAAVNHLVSTGLVRRERDENDRRRNAISITDAGLTEVDRVGAAVDRVQDVVLQQLSESERTTLLRLLAKLS